METPDEGPIRTRRRGSSPGKIFIGGLSRETTKLQLFKHFRRYGEIKDSVVMLDPKTGLPRGFAYVTYENPSVIDKVMEDPHLFNGKRVVIKRALPKGIVGTKDFRTRRIFLTQIPNRLSEGEFKGFFKRFGEVKEYSIVRDDNNYFSGFGFIKFDTEQAVDDLLAEGNKVDLDRGLQMQLHKVLTRWERPRQGFFKLNSDGSSAANPEKSGAGGVIRDDQGQWIVGYSRKLGKATSLCAELWGLRDGLKLAVERGLFDLIIEVDSQVVLDLICGEVVDFPTLDPITKECRSLLKQIPNHLLCQINRESNSCADHLARIGAYMTKDFVFFDQPPDSIRLLIFSESLDPEDNEVVPNGEIKEFKSLNHTKGDSSLSHTEWRADPGKIFIGGLARDITSAQFLEYFGKYGEIEDSVIMKNKETGQRRGFGYVTYADPSVVDKVIKDTHIINGKQVSVKRPIPKGSTGTKDFKTKKISVGGIPPRVSEDEFKDFFSQFGVVNEHQIMQDHATGGSCVSGYITFDTEKAVDDLLAKGNKVELAGAQVEIKRVAPKNQIPHAPLSKLHGDSRNACDASEDSYGGCVGDRFDNIGYRSADSCPHWMEFYREGPSLRYPGHYGESEFGRYGEFDRGMELYMGEPSLPYFGHHGGGEFGRFECHDGAMEPYREDPSLEYLDYRGIDEFGGVREPYREEFSEYSRHVEGGPFGDYGDTVEFSGEEPTFHDHIFRRHYNFEGPTEIYGEYGGAGRIGPGYRGGGGGGSFAGHGGGRGGGWQGHHYHPYAR